jgi:serine/threonine-protein kinase
MKIPQQIGRYQIEKVLGHGGMAVVFLAHDPDLKRHVAIKLLPRQFVFSGEMRVRFIHEARIVAALRHQAIVPIYDFGEFDEQPYLIMPYMPGGSLATRLPGPQPAAVVAPIVERLAPALDKAHAQGIIHRDLKPDNVLFDEDGFPYLADFGIARLAEATQSMTVIGTPAYMSPEQVSGDRQLDGRSDIYALGVIVFEMLTGRPPYEADSPAKLMFKHVHEPVPNIMSVRPDLPPVCQEVIARSMAKSPDARYAKAVDLAQTLAQAVPQGLAGPVAVEQPGPVSDESGAVQTGTPTAALTSEPTALVEGDGRSMGLVGPDSSRERIDQILRGNNRTVGLAVLILLALLCGGMLLVPSIWSALLNLGSF